jgi:hypothetical protein
VRRHNRGRKVLPALENGWAIRPEGGPPETEDMLPAGFSRFGWSSSVVSVTSYSTGKDFERPCRVSSFVHLDLPERVQTAHPQPEVERSQAANPEVR